MDKFHKLMTTVHKLVITIERLLNMFFAIFGRKLKTA